MTNDTRIEYKSSYAGTDISVYVMMNYKNIIQPSNQKEEKWIENNQDAYNKEIVTNEDMKSLYRKLGELSTISYSIYRDKEQVKALGQSMARGFSRGYRTIAGTMVFTVFHDAIMHEIFPRGIADAPYVMVDQLPPVDVLITMCDEAGNYSRLGIYGVEFMNEGQVMSVQDLMTENSVNYVARYVSPLRKVFSQGADRNDIKTSLNTVSTPLLYRELQQASVDYEKLRRSFI